MRHESIVPIASKARELQASGFVKKDASPLSAQFPYQSFEAMQTGEDLKGEFYSLLAVIIDSSLEGTSQVREKAPFGFTLSKKQYEKGLRKNASQDDYPFPREMVANPMPPLTFCEMNSRMNLTLGSIVTSQMHKMHRLAKEPLSGVNQNSPLASVYKRYAEHIDFLKRNIDHNLSPEDVVLNGIGTAVNTMTNILLVIPEVLEKHKSGELKINAEMKQQIAVNSYPLVAKIATGFIWAFKDFDTYLQNGEEVMGKYSPEHFNLKGFPDAPRLDFIPDALSKYDEIYLQYIKNHKNYSFSIPRCPAMVNFGTQEKSNAVSKLWDWHTEMAKPIYKQQNFNSNKRRWY